MSTSARSNSRKGSNESKRVNRKLHADERPRNAGRWTEARYRSFVTSALRSAFRRWPPKFDVLKAAFVDRRINQKSGRLASHYRCAACEGDFPQSNVQVDHVKPISDWSDWGEAIERLFCEADNLQVLCKPCHKKKSASERASTKAERSKALEDKQDS